MEKCGSCKYRIYIYGGKSNARDGHRVACGYILVNHKMRGCDPKHCDKYEEGKPVRMTNPMSRGKITPDLERELLGMT